MKAFFLIALIFALRSADLVSTKNVLDLLPPPVPPNPNNINDAPVSIDVENDKRLSADAKKQIIAFLNKIAAEIDERQNQSESTFSDFVNPFRDIIIPAVIKAINKSLNETDDGFDEAVLSTDDDSGENSNESDGDGRPRLLKRSEDGKGPYSKSDNSDDASKNDSEGVVIDNMKSIFTSGVKGASQRMALFDEKIIPKLIDRIKERKNKDDNDSDDDDHSRDDDNSHSDESKDESSDESDDQDDTSHEDVSDDTDVYNFKKFTESFELTDVVDGQLPNINILKNNTAQLIEKYLGFLKHYKPVVKEIIEKRHDFVDTLQKIIELKKSLSLSSLAKEAKGVFKEIQDLKELAVKLYEQRKEWIESRAQAKEEIASDLRQLLEGAFPRLDPFELLDILNKFKEKAKNVKDLIKKYAEWTNDPNRVSIPFRYKHKATENHEEDSESSEDQSTSTIEYRFKKYDDDFKLADVLDGQSPNINIIKNIPSEWLDKYLDFMKKYKSDIKGVIEKRHAFYKTLNRLIEIKKSFSSMGYPQNAMERFEKVKELKSTIQDLKLKKEEWIKSRIQLKEKITRDIKDMLNNKFPNVDPFELMDILKKLKGQSVNIKDLLKKYADWTNDPNRASIPFKYKHRATDKNEEESKSSKDQSRSAIEYRFKKYDDDFKLLDVIDGQNPNINIIKNIPSEWLDKYLDFLKKYKSDIKGVIEKRHAFYKTLNRLIEIKKSFSSMGYPQNAMERFEKVKELKTTIQDLKLKKEDWITSRIQLKEQMTRDINDMLNNKFPNVDPFELMDILKNLKGQSVNIKDLLKQYADWTNDPNRASVPFRYNPKESASKSDKSESNDEAATSDIEYPFKKYDDSFKLIDVVDGQPPNINMLGNNTSELVTKYMESLKKYQADIEGVIQKRLDFFDTLQKLTDLKKSFADIKYPQDRMAYFKKIQEIKKLVQELQLKKKDWIMSRNQLEAKMRLDFNKKLNEMYPNMDPFELLDILNKLKDETPVDTDDLIKQYAVWTNDPERESKPFVYNNKGINFAALSGEIGNQGEEGVSGLGIGMIVLASTVAAVGTATAGVYVYRKKRRQGLYTRIPERKYSLSGLTERERSIVSPSNGNTQPSAPLLANN